MDSLPQGFRAAGLHCGIKDDPDKFDLALFASEVPCAAAGVFTRNRISGAPVKVSRERLPRRTARSVVINSGNANACTGSRGLEDARWMTAQIAANLGCAEDDVLLCSTGLIGHFLPLQQLADGLPRVVGELADSPEAFIRAAQAMMTTDTVPKLAVREGRLAGKPIRVSGVAKGAAMIGPNMATMLAVILTDAHLEPDEADSVLRAAVAPSFHCISVEGHTSTSDSVLLLANGAAGTGPLSADAKPTLQQMVTEVAIELAQAIIRDAEGAGHCLTIDVSGANDRDEAHRLAQTIAEAPLVKTAIAGADPNWGRIISAAGFAGVALRESDLTLRINGTVIYENGTPADYDERSLSEQMRDHREVHIELGLPFGEGSVRFWTSDLTAEYVRLNAEYTS